MNLQRLLLPTLMALTLTACSDGGGGDDNAPPVGKDAAVVATRAPDFSSGAISLVDATAPFAARNNLAPTISDILVRSGGDHYFVIERFQADRIKRYSAANPDTPVYTYSTQDAGDSASSNPADLVIASPTKAYLLRYGSGKLWIVNPSAATEAGFKLGEIDLSAYDADGVPEMSAGLIHNGRLYVAMQRLESFASVKNGYVAVIDIATDQEVTTGAGTATLKGIELPVRDPIALGTDPADGSILLLADGGFDGNFTEVYEGGIVRINPADHRTTLLLDDGDDANHPYGQFADLAMVTAGRGYFVGSTGFFGAQTLYRYDPAGGAPVAVTGFSDRQLGAIAVAPSGQLWVSLTADDAPGLAVLDFAGGIETVASVRVDTVLTPLNIDFVTLPPTTTP